MVSVSRYLWSSEIAIFHCQASHAAMVRLTMYLNSGDCRLSHSKTGIKWITGIKWAPLWTLISHHFISTIYCVSLKALSVVNKGVNLTFVFFMLAGHNAIPHFKTIVFKWNIVAVFKHYIIVIFIWILIHYTIVIFVWILISIRPFYVIKRDLDTAIFQHF